MHRTPRRSTDRSPGTPRDEVRVRLLGHFEVIVNGEATPERGWTRRRAAALVKVLALAPGHRLHREQVMDLLWPDEPPADAAPKLHKAAHYARKVAGGDAVVLRNDIVLLFPSADLTVDVTDFDELSRRAVVEGEPATARAAIARYTGELLPDDRYEEWATERRELLRLRHLHLLRLAGQWMELSELDPCDEDAHLEVVRDHVAHGAHDAARSQYERMEHVLDRHLGVAPSCTAQDLRGEIDADAASGPAPVVEIAGHHRLSEGRVAALVAELTELTRRQAILLDTLTGAACGTSRLACVAVAS